MDELANQIYEIIKKHRKSRDYFVGDPFKDNPTMQPLDVIWFSELMKRLYLDYAPKSHKEVARKVKAATVELEKLKKIIYCPSEPPFFILYEDRDKVNKE